MTAILHPYRYKDSLDTILNRLEQVAPGVTDGRLTKKSESVLHEEMAGMSEEDLNERSEYLQHLELLVALWKENGENVIIEQPDIDNPLVSSFGAGLSARPPEGVTYVSFAGTAPTVGAEQDAVIEGFYVREIDTDAGLAAEVTLVCAGADWEEIDSARYSDAVRTLSRLAVGVVPIGISLTREECLQALHGDRELLEDPAVLKAWAMASFAIDTSIGIVPSLGMGITCH